MLSSSGIGTGERDGVCWGARSNISRKTLYTTCWFVGEGEVGSGGEGRAGKDVRQTPLRMGGEGLRMTPATKTVNNDVGRKGRRRGMREEDVAQGLADEKKLAWEKAFTIRTEGRGGRGRGQNSLAGTMMNRLRASRAADIEGGEAGRG